MRFGVLGPLAVWAADGGQVAIPGRKVRALLADLIVHAGRPVSTHRLIDDLWGEDRTANPGGALQAKVSQLRRALEEAEPGARALVVSRPPGYLLQVEPDAVDATRFTGLLTQARQAEDPHARAALLTDALALWRGAALADFGDEVFAQAMLTRLEEQRLTALEEQAETRLELGEHSLLSGELSDLVARHPLRERLRAAQMRALYRAGRQSDALASYTALRERLLDELGLDPGPELASLQHAILEQDPALGRPQTPGRVQTNLPTPLTDLIGRAGAIDEVRTLLGSARLVTLTGPGGVGKTRLAVETAAQQAGAFPDGAWIVELAGPAPAQVVEVVTAVLGLRDDAVTGPVRPADRLADALRGKRLLLVLDNCEHVIEPVAELTERLLRAAPGLRVLATSQEPLGLAGEQLWTVPPLTGADAIELFTARAAAAGRTLGEDDTAAVTAICRRLDGIPLALELAATRVRTLGVRELADRLDDRFRLLAGGRRDLPARQQTLRAMIDWSWDLLTEPERLVLRRLAVHPDGCTLKAAETCCAEDGVDVVGALTRLVDRSLVTVTDGPRYRLLESVSAYSLERLHEAGEYESIRHRHDDYYVSLAERAEPRLRTHDQRQWLERLDAETANLRAVLERQDAYLALRLVNALAWYWFLRGRLGEGHRSLTTALGTPGGAPAARASATAWRTGFALLGQHGTDRRAQSLAALAPYEHIDDPAGQARAEWFLGFVLWGGGDQTTSENLIDHSLVTFRTLGDSWGLAAALTTRASQALLRGDLTALQRDGEEGAALFRGLGDRWGQVRALGALGTLAEITGDYERSARLHRDGLRMAEELGLWPQVSRQLAELGRISLLTNDHAEAQDLHERALRLAAEQSFRSGEVFARVGLALGARREGKLDIAESHMREVLGWNRQVGYQPGVAHALAELGFTAEQRGEAETARSLHLESLAVAQTTGDQRAIALALEGLAGAQALAGSHDQAARLLGSATAARQSVNAPLPEAERTDVNRITAAVQHSLGAEIFTTHFEHGYTAARPAPP